MTPGHMTDVILATMMTAEVVAAVDVIMTTIMVADGIMTGQEIMTEEIVIAVVMAEIGMMTGGTKGRQDFTGCYWVVVDVDAVV